MLCPLKHPVLMSMLLCVYQWIAGVNTQRTPRAARAENETASPAGRTSVVWAPWSGAALGHWRATACLGTQQSVFFSAQLVGWRAISQALWINLWQDPSRIKQNWAFNLTCHDREFSGDKPGQRGLKVTRISWVLLKNKIRVHILLQVSGTHGQINN